MPSMNYGKSRVDLMGDWKTLAEQLPGVTMIGVIHPKNGPVAALGVDAEGQYLAINGRYITRLVNRKVHAAIDEAKKD